MVAVFITAFLDLVGFSIIFPLFPSMLEHYVAVEGPGSSVGLLAESLHGITRELLKRHGRPARWMAEQLNARLAGQTVYCDGWGQDYPWLARLFDAAALPQRFKLDDLRKLLTEAEAPRWRGVVDTVRQRQRLTRHRASSDARVLQLALGEIKQSVSA